MAVNMKAMTMNSNIIQAAGGGLVDETNHTTKTTKNTCYMYLLLVVLSHLVATSYAQPHCKYVCNNSIEHFTGVGGVSLQCYILHITSYCLGGADMHLKLIGYY